MIRSKDGGRKWEKLDGDFSDNGKNYAMAIEIDEDDPTHLYAAMRSGMSGRGGGNLYASEDSGDSWRKINVEVPTVGAMKVVNA